MLLTSSGQTGAFESLVASDKNDGHYLWSIHLCWTLREQFLYFSRQLQTGSDGSPWLSQINRIGRSHISCGLCQRSSWSSDVKHITHHWEDLLSTSQDPHKVEAAVRKAGQLLCWIKTNKWTKTNKNASVLKFLLSGLLEIEWSFMSKFILCFDFCNLVVASFVL